ncbi:MULTISPECIES: NADPH-dependent FMN reductase [Ramlibacter]|uniref:NADPH-dependent FMN reductase n=1 Tax=Ramlibacter pinisoli TaxID=2682844 RepID=A0A6N8IT16_9BURK|nr:MULTISPECIES: NADPH-dependent FMN reductase [Ramlibacter]MBA2965104.1 NAD(P)H-dependent oxidoreductase [Ramlibacter sp. CGMCC 1.13660]MVQ30069.1 NADPH-dependent FMN reductase [Ramlibacter pinisoli]
MKVLGISGSLRAGSYNTMALRAAQKLAPAGMEIEVASIAEVPLYNDDVRAAGEPAPVSALKAKVRAADGILLVTPEFNFSIPGVLKNTLDWLSRPPEPPFAGKPVAIMGVSPGPVGTARVQYDLRKVLVFLDAFTVNKPEVFINNCASKFDASGNFTDEAGSRFIGDLLVSLQKLKARLG